MFRQELLELFDYDGLITNNNHINDIKKQENNYVFSFLSKMSKIINNRR